MSTAARTVRRVIVAAGLTACVLGSAACGGTVDNGGGGPGGDGGTGGIDAATGPQPDAHPGGFNGEVYAHSSSDLYSIDPDTLAVMHVGAFVWNTTPDVMTDIAIDKTGNMIGISYTEVWSVDKSNAHATHLASLDRMFNGLSFVPADQVDPTGNEILVGAALDGTVYKIDPMTGASTSLGNYMGGLGSSGDLVAVEGAGAFATVTNPAGSGNDYLAHVDVATGKATLIGDTGFDQIWGLGFWKGKVFGFTNGMQFVLIDTGTGHATAQAMGSDVQWWGAAVTTSAPIIP